LQELLHGTLSAEQQATLTAHLDGCASCQRTLEHLAAGSVPWPAAPHRLGQHQPAPEPGLRRVINELKEKDGQTRTWAEPVRDDETLEFLDPPRQQGHLGRLGPYDVTEVIGRGGMGVVLKAFDPELHRVVAIKVLAPQLATSATARRRFVREAQAAAAVSHEHVVTIHGVDETRGLPYLVMEYIAGVSLQERLDRSGPLDVKAILRIGMQAASGLAAAHAQGLIHRDVKPANILLENGVERVKLTDFGLARAADDARLTQSGVIVGTPQYMSPEQGSGSTLDHRADLFSLGSVLYALCTGRPPFRASTALAVIRRVCNDTPRPVRDLNPDIPDWLAAIIDQLMAKNPADRFGSAREVAELLGRHLAHVQQPTLVPLPPRVARRTGARSPRRSRALHAALAALVLLGACLVAAIVSPTLVPEATQSAPAPAPQAQAPVQAEVPPPTSRAEHGQPLLPPGEIRRFLGHTGTVRRVALSADGRRLLSTGGWPAGDGTIRLWDVASGKELHRFEGGLGQVLVVEFSPDGTRALSGSGDATIPFRLWDLVNRREVHRFAGPGQYVMSAAFSPDGRRALSGGGDQAVHLWDVATGKELRRFEGHTGAVNGIAFSPDGKFALSGAWTPDNTVRLWDLATGKELRRLTGHTAGIEILAVSPNGHQVLSAGMDKTVRLWDVATGQELLRLGGHTQTIFGVAFSPDGGRAVSGSQDGTVRLWDLATGWELHRESLGVPVYSVAFTPDGRHVVSGSGDGTIRLWRLYPEEAPDPQALAQPFVLRHHGNYPAQTFATLAEAVTAAWARDTIEVQGNGPFRTPPIVVHQALTIRAGPGARPVIELNLDVPKLNALGNDALLEAHAPLTLEGLELHRLNPQPWQHGKALPVLVLTDSTLHLANCCFVLARTRDSILSYYGALVDVRNCEFLGGNQCYHVDWCCPTGGRLILHNNVVSGGEAALGFHYRHPGLQDVSLRLTGNTLKTAMPLALLLDRIPEPAAKPGTSIPIRVEATGNLFDGREAVMTLAQDPTFIQPAQRLSANAALAVLPRVVAWEGQHNLYAANRDFLNLTSSVPGQPPAPAPLHSVAAWNSLWQRDDTMSLQGPIHYQQDIPAAARLAPQQLRPADFRLRPDSAGYRAGAAGCDLGADVDLVGPGEAYEAWRKTPAYRQWLKDTDYAPPEPQPEPEAFVVLGREGRAERKFDFLTQAVKAAASGDTIEVRGNGPFVTHPILIQRKALTIRAAAGFWPVIRLSPEGVQAFKTMIETNAALVLEGLEVEKYGLPGWEAQPGKPYPQLLRSIGLAPLRLANCRLVTRYCIAVHGDPRPCEVRNCELLTLEGFSPLEWFCHAGSRLVVENNLIAGRPFVGIHPSYDHADLRDVVVRVARNTIVGGNLFTFSLNRAPDPARDHPIRIELTENVIDGPSVLRLNQSVFYLAHSRRLPAAEAEALLPRLLNWHERHNLYTVSGEFLELNVNWQLLPPTRSRKSLAAWQQFLDRTAAGCREGRVRYQTLNPLARLSAAPETVTASDFRLQPASPGYRAGPSGCDLGMDADLVGPGRAYERWKQTPAYQQWLQAVKGG
jgi:WD40 repeat protein